MIRKWKSKQTKHKKFQSFSSSASQILGEIVLRTIFLVTAAELEFCILGMVQRLVTTVYLPSLSKVFKIFETLWFASIETIYKTFIYVYKIITKSGNGLKSYLLVLTELFKRLVYVRKRYFGNLNKKTQFIVSLERTCFIFNNLTTKRWIFLKP